MEVASCLNFVSRSSGRQGLSISLIQCCSTACDLQQMILLPGQLHFNTRSRQAEPTTGRTCPCTAVSPMARDGEAAAVPTAARLCHLAVTGQHRAAAAELLGGGPQLNRQVLSTSLPTGFQGMMSSITFCHALVHLPSVLQLRRGLAAS